VTEDHEKLTLLIISLLNVAVLSLGHAGNKQLLILGALALFWLSVVFSPKANFLPLMLFYLPWSPVLKLRPDSFTFFTLVVPAIFVIIFLTDLKNRQKYKTELIVLLFLFTAYTLLVKFINQMSIDMSYFFFIIMLFFIPIYAKQYMKDISFEKCTLFLTAGVLSASAASKILMNFPQMLRYINVYKWESVGLTRFSGFYEDPNFYSVQIIMAVAAILTVMSKTTKKPLIPLQLLAVLALVFFGLLSVSKMFLLSLGAILALWVFSLKFKKQNVMYEAGALIVILAVVIAAYFSDVLTAEINQYVFRFTQSAFTTGRTDLQIMYLDYLFSNSDKLFFGIGFSNILLNLRASHNTMIQIVWQIGLIGGVLLYYWQRLAFAPVLNRIKFEPVNKITFIMLVGAYFLPWLALDFLSFDEFFYYFLLVLIGKNYLAEKQLGGNAYG